MPTRDYQDIIGGAALILTGAFVTAYALATLSMGTITEMGPGMFPAALGVILAGLGVAVLVPAIFRAGEMPGVDLRSLLTISFSILAFAVILRPFGLIPAIVVSTLVASRADSKMSLPGVVLLAAGLALGATLIFRVGLGVLIPILAWPW